MPRTLKCPRCATINTIEDGDPPACRNCAFGTGNQGPPPGSEGAQFKRVPPTGPPPPPPPPPTPIALMVSVAFLGLGTLALLGLHFLPWSVSELTHDGAVRFEQAHSLWIADGTGTDPSGRAPSYGYWSGAAGDVDGIWLLRVVGPLTLVALVLAGVSCAAAAMRKGGLCLPCGWAAVGVTAVAVILFALGAQAQQEQLQEAALGQEIGSVAVLLDLDWAPGFYLGIAAAALVAVGTTFGPMRTQAPEAAAPQWPAA